MKSNKMIAILAVGLLAICPTLRAADTTTPPSTATPPAGGPPGGGFRGGRGMLTIEQITTNLSLTADQIPKVKAVLDDQRQKMADLRADTSLSQDDRRTQMMAIRTDVTAKMKEILTDDQFAKYQKMTQRGRRGGAGGGGNNGGGNPTATTPP